MVKYPDKNTNPQTVIFTNFSAKKFNNNKPLKDEYGNIFSLIFTVYKGDAHGNPHDISDSENYTGYLNIQCSGKLNVENPTGQPYISFEIKLDGNTSRNYNKKGLSINNGGTTLINFFPENDENVNIPILMNNTAVFSDIFIQFQINSIMYMLYPEIDSLSVAFSNISVINTNFKLDSGIGKTLLNINGEPLTYAFNFAFDSKYKKYLISYGEVISSKIICDELDLNPSYIFDKESSISYTQKAYGAEFDSGLVEYEYNDTCKYAFFPPFEGVTIYTYDLFELEIYNISIVLNSNVYKFTSVNSLVNTHILNTRGTRALATQLSTEILKRFYMISTNTDLPVEAPRPIDINFSSISESTINITLDSEEFPLDFSDIRIISDNITLNDNVLDIVFDINKNGNIYNITSTLPSVYIGDTFYFGLIEVQGYLVDDDTYISFGSFYDRKYKILQRKKAKLT